jgi:hypothetical protein
MDACLGRDEHPSIHHPFGAKGYRGKDPVKVG